MKDELGDRMKDYESIETVRRLDTSRPIYARLDGRAFSKFTKGMQRPFDPLMTSSMIETTKYLVEKTNAKIGYVQSDEISLVWFIENPETSDMFFSGKVQKLCSVLSGMATAKFNSVIPANWQIKLPHFDCRVLQLPSKVEAANMLLWRTLDASRNAISMVAQHNFSHKDLRKKSTEDMEKMLEEKNILMDSFPDSFRYGSFIRREVIERYLTNAELEEIPEKYRPDCPVLRTEMTVVEGLVPFIEVKNRVEVIFNYAIPELEW